MRSCAPGTSVDALVRNREKAADSAGARRAPGPRRSRAAARLRGAWRRPPTASIHAALDDCVPRRRRSTRWRSTRSSVAGTQPRRSSSTRRASGCSGRRRRRSTRLLPLNPIEQSAWRAPHEQRVLDAARADLRTRRRPPGHRLWRLARDRRRSVQGGRQRPGSGDWHRRESLAARLRPRSRRAVSAARNQPDGVGRVPRQRRM